MIKLPQSFTFSHISTPAVVNSVFKHPFILLIAASTAANGLLWLLAMRYFPRDNPVAVLHYTAGMGIDFIGEGSHITVLPTIGALVLLANGILGWTVIKADPRASWVIWSAVPAIQIVLLAAFYLIWRIN